MNTNNSAKRDESRAALRRLVAPLFFVLAIFLLVVLCYDAGYSGLPPTEKRYAQAKAGIANLKLDEKAMRAINNMSDIENETGTAYMEQAYLQGICDGIRFVKFFQQNG